MAGVAKFSVRTATGIVNGVTWVGESTANGARWMTRLGRKPAVNQSGPVGETTQAAAAGAARIWEALEEAGQIVLTSARNNALTVTEHRYGSDAAQVAKHGMDAVVHTGGAVASFSARAIARKAAKKTAKRVLFAQVAGAAKAGKAR